MAATHEFTQSINIGATRYSAGTRCSVSDIPPGNFDSLTRLGILVPLPPQTDHAPTPDLTPGPTPEAPVVETPKPDSGDDPDATPAEIAAKKAATKKK